MSAFTTEVKSDNLPFDARFPESLEQQRPLQVKNLRRPKNIRKRDIESASDEQVAQSTAPEGGLGSFGLTRVEEIRFWQQSRASRQRRSPLSLEEDELTSQKNKKVTTGSLSNNFTVQVQTVDPLDERLDAYIQQEMTERRAQLLNNSKEGTPDYSDANTGSLETDSANGKSMPDDASLSADAKTVSESDALEASASQSGGLEGGYPESLPGAPEPVIVDLSCRVLKAASNQSNSYSSHEHERRWYKEAPSRPVTAILEVDLPIEDQLKIIEETNLAAKQQFVARKQRVAKPNLDTLVETGFENLDRVSVPRHYNSDFSKYLKYQNSHENKPTDDIAYDRYRKNQSYK